MLARRLLACVRKNRPFVPFPHALYINRTGIWSITIVDGVIVISPWTVSGLRRRTWGIPVQTSTGKIAIFGRDSAVPQNEWASAFTILSAPLSAYFGPAGYLPTHAPAEIDGPTLPMTLNLQGAPVVVGGATVAAPPVSVTDDPQGICVYDLTDQGVVSAPVSSYPSESAFVEYEFNWSALPSFVGSSVNTYYSTSAFSAPSGVIVDADGPTSCTLPFVITSLIIMPIPQYSKLSAITDVFGTSMLSIFNTYDSAIPPVLISTVTIYDFSQTTTSYSLNISAGFMKFNFGDALYFASSDSAYPNWLKQTQPSGSALVQHGDGPGTIFLTFDRTRLFDNSTVPLFWGMGQSPVAVPLSPFTTPLALGCIGRSISTGPTFVTNLGPRSGIGYLALDVQTYDSVVVPVTDADATLSPASISWGGETYNLAAQRVTSTTSVLLVNVAAGVARAIVLSKETTTTYLEIGQAVDTDGNPTGNYINWSAPGDDLTTQAQIGATVGPVVSGPMAVGAQPSAIINYNSRDYAISWPTHQAVLIDGSSAVTFSLPIPGLWGADWIGVVIPHASALLIIPTSSDSTNSYAGALISTDLGATWTDATISDSAGLLYSQISSVYPYQGVQGKSISPGSPLFAY